MNDSLEILLFDIATLYFGVHLSAREVCAQRGITLRELDLSDHQDLAIQHQVRHFPQCLLLRSGRLIAETHAANHSPKSLSAWLDSALASESQPVSALTP